MASETAQVDRTALDDQTKAALDAARADRKSLEGIVAEKLKDLWTESLRCLEEALPHTMGDGSANEKLFKAHRYRILNRGNSLARSMAVELEDFVVTQVATRQVVQVARVKGRGPFDLPQGVRMPGDRPASSKI